MARTTPDALKAYVTVPSDFDVAPFIEDAATLMDAYLPASGLSEPILTLIEKNLAAHLLTLAYERGGLVVKKVGESSETYAKAGEAGGLRSTRFGQMALSLDSTGALEGIGSTVKTAQFRVVTTRNTIPGFPC